MMLSAEFLLKALRHKRVKKMTRQELLSLQQKKLQKLLKYVSLHSPFYRRFFAEKNLNPETTCIEQLPVMTKSLLTKNFDEIVTDRKVNLAGIKTFVQAGNDSKLYLDSYHVMETSGTSGEPGFIISTPHELLSGVSAAGGESKISYKKKMALVGISKPFAASRLTALYNQRLVLGRLLLQSRFFSLEQPFQKIIQELNEFQPKVISGYAKTLLLLADAQNSGALTLNLDSVESGGEQLLETDRKYLKETFSCNINNHYGSTEFFTLGIARDGEPGISLFEDHCQFEIGSEETLVTNLDSYSLPLIRFQMKDVLTPILAKENDRVFRLVESQIGRADEIPFIVTGSGDRQTVLPICFDRLMPDQVKTFSISSEIENDFCFHVVLKNQNQLVDEIKVEIQKRIHNFFESRDLSYIKFNIEIQNKTPTNNRNGKTQFWRHRALGAK